MAWLGGSEVSSLRQRSRQSRDVSRPTLRKTVRRCKRRKNRAAPVAKPTQTALRKTFKYITMEMEMDWFKELAASPTVTNNKGTACV
jgi:hypothetical protein